MGSVLGIGSGGARGGGKGGVGGKDEGKGEDGGGARWVGWQRMGGGIVRAVVEGKGGCLDPRKTPGRMDR